jgi:MutS domain V
MIIQWIHKYISKQGSTKEDCSGGTQEAPPAPSPFKLPITYVNSQPLNPVLVSDLELVQSSCKPLYEHLFQPSHVWGRQMIPAWSKQFSTDPEYLRDTQEIIRSMAAYQETMKWSAAQTPNCESFQKCWDEIHIQHFLEKYNYLEWDWIKHLNESSIFLQLLSMGNMMSPIISLLIPIIFLVIPFFILKFKGIPITISVYLQILQDIAKHHFIGKAIAGIQSLSFDKIISVILMLGLYVMQIYQNIVICWRFYENTKNLNHRLMELRDHVKYSILSMRTFLDMHSDKPSYTSFCDDLRLQMSTLQDLLQWLEHVSEFQFGLQKGSELGYMLRVNYELWKNQTYQEALQYSVGFEGFIDNLRGVHDHWSRGNVSFATIENSLDVDEDNSTDQEEEGEDDAVKPVKKASLEFRDQYYPVLLSGRGDEIITNDLNMTRNILLTGPNASGKTTFLKTTALNLIFTQQLGGGFYSSGKLPKLYTHIHSYLNIPDTSERDSLFQAEARRCKDILDIIHDERCAESQHFCIFDELYSGTNPKEASKAAYAFLKYLSQLSNVDFILTTHYTDMCKRFLKSDRVKNYQMMVELTDGKVKYMYQIHTGISKVEGAVKILEDMNYPEEIMCQIKE